MRKNIFILLVLIVGFTKFNYSQYYTAIEITTIHTSKSGSEGDMYKDTANDLQYIGVTDGSLKLLSPHYVRVITKMGSYTVSLGESGSVITFNNSLPVVLTIPTGLPIGYNLSVYQIGTGNVTIIGDLGVSVLNRLSTFKSAGKDSGVGIISTATNVFHVTGDLKK